MNIPNSLVELEGLETGYFEGSLPSWQEFSGQGTHSVDGSGTQGGRATLKTGTTAVGDESRIQSTMPWRISFHGGISVSMHGEVKFNADPNKAHFKFGLSNGTDNWIEFDPIRGQIEAMDDGTSTVVDTVGCDPENRFHAELRYYYFRGYAEAIYSGAVVGRIETGLPNPDRGDFRSMWRLITQDTASNKTLRLRGTGVQYFDDKQI